MTDYFFSLRRKCLNSFVQDCSKIEGAPAGDNNPVSHQTFLAYEHWDESSHCRIRGVQDYFENSSSSGNEKLKYAIIAWARGLCLFVSCVAW